MLRGCADIAQAALELRRRVHRARAPGPVDDVEAFKELAGVKKPSWSPGLLRARPVAQSQLGEAEGLLRAGRAFIFESLGDARGRSRAPMRCLVVTDDPAILPVGCPGLITVHHHAV